MVLAKPTLGVPGHADHLVGAWAKPTLGVPGHADHLVGSFNWAQRLPPDLDHADISPPP
jgi:hypothetical protein